MATRIALLFLLALLPPAARAASEGGFGAIGSSGVYGPNAHCVFCHRGGQTPTVELTGPALVPAGGRADYQLTIRGGAAVVGGFSAEVREVDDWSAREAILVPGTGAQQPPHNPAEVVHSAPRAFEDGEVSFAFTLIAPARPGALVLFAAGNSCNGNGTSEGDASAATRLEIDVYLPTPPVEPTGAPDAGPVHPEDPVSGPGPDQSPSAGGCASTSGPPLWLALVLAPAWAGRLKRYRSSRATCWAIRSPSMAEETMPPA